MTIDPSALHEFTEVRPSLTPGAGLGLFATRFIPRGTIWWCARPDNVIRLSRQQYKMLLRSHLAQSESSRHLLRVIHGYCYFNKTADEAVLTLDDGRFVNHSDQPNSVGEPSNPAVAVAARDIAPGEEITEDYRTYSLQSWNVPDEPFLQ